MAYEHKFISQYPCFLISSDEAGRGPLAGPVLAGSVALKLHNRNTLKNLSKRLLRSGIGDSKGLSPLKRQTILNEWAPGTLNNNDLYAWEHQDIFGTWSLKTSGDIDQMNILQASLSAMHESAVKLESVFNTEKLPVVWIIDGNQKPKVINPEWQVFTVIHGDALSPLIGLASIIAKEKRDLMMAELHQEFPLYGFDQNAGYPTKDHRRAIEEHGPSIHHRRTYKGVREFLERTESREPSVPDISH